MTSARGISRRNLSFIGVDILTISGADNVTRALASGDLVRFTDVVNSIDETSWIIRHFFPLSRFFSSAHGFFIPFRGSTDPNYAPCHDFLTSTLTQPLNLTTEIRHAAHLIIDPTNLPSDKTLGAAFTRALAARFVSHVPDNIIDAADKQVGSVAESFLPWKFLPAREAVNAVYGFFERETANRYDVPKACVTDMGHTVMAGMHFGPTIMRALAVHTEDDVETIMAGVGPTKEVLRMPRKETTLDGLVPGGGSISQKTMVLLNIRDAARSTGDVAWVFGTGSGNRSCCAQGAILGFLREVQAEVLRLRNLRTA